MANTVFLITFLSDLLSNTDNFIYMERKNNTFLFDRVSLIASCLLPTNLNFKRRINKQLSICDLLTVKC